MPAALGGTRAEPRFPALGEGVATAVGGTSTWLAASLVSGGLAAIAGTYNEVALMNAGAKLVHGLIFFRDALGGLAIGAPVVLVGLLALAIARAVRVLNRG